MEKFVDVLLQLRTKVNYRWFVLKIINLVKIYPVDTLQEETLQDKLLLQL